MRGLYHGGIISNPAWNASMVHGAAKEFQRKMRSYQMVGRPNQMNTALTTGFRNASTYSLGPLTSGVQRNRIGSP